jgi:hypothetical protein
MSGAAAAGGDLAVATVAAKSHLPFARVLARSLRERHPDVPFYVALTDEVEGCFDPAGEPFELVPIAALGIPDLRRFVFRYDRREVAVAAKAFVLDHLLERGFARALFLDADTWVTADLSPLFDALEQRSILLTPHLVEPARGPDAARRELTIAAAGAYNGGVVGVRREREARRFLAWWQARLLEHCELAPARGLHHDQGWDALVPALFDDVGLCRDPGVNVAYWNLPERPLERRGDEWLAGGRTLRLAHFSGFDPEAPANLSRHAPRPARLPDAVAELWRRYAEALLAAGWLASRAWPYGFGRFDDGSAIPDLARKLYGGLGAAATRFGDPFATERPDCFADWLTGAAAGEAEIDLARTPLWAAVLASRPDARAAFPDPSGADREGFRRWAASSGAREHGIAARFLPEPIAGGR